MDSLDLKALRSLMADGRVSWSDLANELGLSAPSSAERVHRMEQQGVIKGYAAIIDPSSVGSEVAAFVSLTLDHPRNRDAFISLVQDLPEVQECHHIAGDYDYLLKVRCRNTKDLDRVISIELKGLEGVTKTCTTIVLDTAKETPDVPLFSDLFASRS